MPSREGSCVKAREGVLDVTFSLEETVDFLSYISMWIRTNSLYLFIHPIAQNQGNGSLQDY